MQVKKGHFAGVSNIHHGGPKGLSTVLNSKVDREGLAAIAPLANDADLPTVVAKVNAILAALKLQTPAT